MNRGLVILGGLGWFGLVFWVVLYLSFPAEAVAAFVTRVVAERSHGAWAVEIDDARPWWVGLSGSSVVLSAIEGGVEQPVMLADRVALRLSPWALLRKGRQFYAEATMGEAELSGQVSAVDEEGQLRLRRLLVEADGVPLDLASGALRGKDGGGFGGEGAVDAVIDLKITEGLDKASGTIELTGDGLRLTSISAPNQGVPEMEIDAAITELDIRLSGEEGALEFVRGVIHSTLADIDITGEVKLADAWDRSKVDLQIEMQLGSWAGTPLEKYQGMAEGFLATAKCDDGKYHYEVDSVVGRLGVGDLQPQRCKTDRAASAQRGPYTPPIPGAPTGVPPDAAAKEPATTPTPPPEPVRENPAPVEDEVPAEDAEDEKPAEDEEEVLEDP